MKALHKTNGGYLGVSYTETFDPHWDNCVLAVPMGGRTGDVAGGTTFADVSPAGKTITSNGGAAFSSTQSKFYGLSGYFDGVDDYLSCGSDPDLAAGDFFMSGWLYSPSDDGDAPLFCNFSSGWGAGSSFLWQTTSSAGLINGLSLHIRTSGGSAVSPAISAVPNIPRAQWNHLAAGRLGNTWVLWANGVVLATVTNSNAIASSGNPLLFGKQQAGSFLAGYAQDFMIHKGVCPPGITNFAPPTRGLLTRARRYPSGVWRAA